MVRLGVIYPRAVLPWLEWHRFVNPGNRRRFADKHKPCFHRGASSQISPRNATAFWIGLLVTLVLKWMGLQSIYHIAQRWEQRLSRRRTSPLLRQAIGAHCVNYWRTHALHMIVLIAGWRSSLNVIVIAVPLHRAASYAAQESSSLISQVPLLAIIVVRNSILPTIHFCNPSTLSSILPGSSCALRVAACGSPIALASRAPG